MFEVCDLRSMDGGDQLTLGMRGVAFRRAIRHGM